MTSDGPGSNSVVSHPFRLQIPDVSQRSLMVLFG